jgi:hypothetical protein
MSEQFGPKNLGLDLDNLKLEEVRFDEGLVSAPDEVAPKEEAERVLADSPRLKYDDKFVAFIDLLGFRQIVMRTSRNSGRDDASNFRKDTLARVHGALSSVPEDDYRDLFTSKYLPGRDKDQGLKLGVSGFSDTLIFWCDDRAETFGLLVHAVFQTVREFMLRGFYCRGGIALGELLIDDEAVQNKTRSTPVMFGPAFIRAYDLEQKQAGEARIILCNDATRKLKQYLNEARDYELTRFLRDYLYQSADGPWQIDIFADIRNAESSHEGTLLPAVATISSKLSEVMDEYVESPTVYRKLAAVARSLNGAITQGSTAIASLNDHKVALPKGRNS